MINGPFYSDVDLIHIYILCLGNSNTDIWCKNRCYDKGQYLLISINTKFIHQYIHFVLTTLYTCSILIWLFFYSRSYPYLLQSHLLHYHSGCEKSDDANAKIPSQYHSWLPTHLLALICSRNSFLQLWQYVICIYACICVYAHMHVFTHYLKRGNMHAYISL